MGWFAYYYMVGELIIVTTLFHPMLTAVLDFRGLKDTVAWKIMPEAVAVILWLTILLSIIAWPLMVAHSLGGKK